MYTISGCLMKNGKATTHDEHAAVVVDKQSKAQQNELKEPVPGKTIATPALRADDPLVASFCHPFFSGRETVCFISSSGFSLSTCAGWI